MERANAKKGARLKRTLLHEYLFQGLTDRPSLATLEFWGLRGAMTEPKQTAKKSSRSRKGKSA